MTRAALMQSVIASLVSASVAGSLSALSSVAVASENLTTAAYAEWRTWGAFTNLSDDWVKLGGTTAMLPATLLGGAVRNNALSFASAATLTSNANQATKLSDSSTGTLSNSAADDITVTANGDGFSVAFPASTTSRAGKVIVCWQSDNGSGRSVDVRAHLSDASAADTTTTLTSTGFGVIFAEYTFTWNAASAGQTLTLSVKTNAGSGTGFVGIQLAAWA